MQLPRLSPTNRLILSESTVFLLLGLFPNSLSLVSHSPSFEVVLHSTSPLGLLFFLSCAGYLCLSISSSPFLSCLLPPDRQPADCSAQCTLSETISLRGRPMPTDIDKERDEKNGADFVPPPPSRPSMKGGWLQYLTCTRSFMLRKL